MSSVKKIFTLMLSSIASLPFYAELSRVKFRDSITAYLLFVCLLTLFNTVWFIQVTVPTIQEQIATSINQVVAAYPEKVIIEWNGSELKTNTSPIIIKMPDAAPEVIASLSDNLLIINTDASPVDQLALFTATDSTLTLWGAGQTGQPIELATLFQAPFVLSKETLPALQLAAHAASRTAVDYARNSFFLLYFVFILLTRSVMLIFEASIIYLLFRLNRIEYSYLKVLQICLHIFIPAEIVHQVAMRIIPDFPVSFHSLSFWILFLLIFFTTQFSERPRVAEK